jgi:hypothetical protein
MAKMVPSCKQQASDMLNMRFASALVFVSSHPLVCLRPSYVHAVDEIARISHLTRSPLRVVNFGVMLIVEFITAG